MLHGETLLALADAMVGDDADALARVRDGASAKLGPVAFVDAVAVVSNFERMVRIADATGIPLDGRLELMTQDLRQELGLERFGAAANTPQPGPGRRAAGRVLRPLARGALRVVGRVSRR